MRFSDNIQRVENLIGLYENSSAPSQGRRPVHSSDILRAATVLLHAAFEGYLRELERNQLPIADSTVLGAVPLVGSMDNKKFDLSVVAEHRGETVNELIEESAESYLARRSYSSSSEVASILERIGFDVGPVQPHLSNLEEMIRRRHHIVIKPIDTTKAVLGTTRPNRSARRRSNAG